MVHIENLNFGYTGQEILSIPRIEIREGQHMMILGNSGSGKTTLLHILGGLLKPKEGKVTIDGIDLYKQSATARDKYRGRSIGLVFQKPHLISALTVQGNLLLAQYLSGMAQDKDRIRAVLSELDLVDKINARVKRLSQGEQQRVTIARALLNKPRVILADEPTASLDDDNSSRVINLLKGQAEKNGASLIIATHDQRVKKEFDLHLDLNES